MKTYLCATSTGISWETEAPDEEEAAMAYALAVLGTYQGSIAAVWVGVKGEPAARQCVTVMIPGACPFETQQFRAFVEWVTDALGCTSELAWNKAVVMLVRTDMGYEITPGVVPITLQDKETAIGHMETFEWKLAGHAPQEP